MTALLATVIAALVAGPLAIWIKGRVDRRHTERGETISAKATIAKVTEDRITELFEEHKRLRATYRSDIDDLRAQLRESNGRVGLLESEVAEWRAGVRGVEGVWVAIPSHVWDFVRDNLPNLPATRFPGERETRIAD